MKNIQSYTLQYNLKNYNKNKIKTTYTKNNTGRKNHIYTSNIYIKSVYFYQKTIYIHLYIHSTLSHKTYYKNSPLYVLLAHL